MCFLYSFLHSSTALCFWLSTVTRFSHVIFSKSHKCQFPSEYSVLTNQSILLLLCSVLLLAYSLFTKQWVSSLLLLACLYVCYLNECESILFYSLCSAVGFVVQRGLYQFSYFSYFSTLSHTLYRPHSVSIFFYLYFILEVSFQWFFQCAAYTSLHTFFYSVYNIFIFSIHLGPYIFRTHTKERPNKK